MTVRHDILLSGMTASDELDNAIRQTKTATDMTKTSRSNPVTFLHNNSHSFIYLKMRFLIRYRC